MGPRDVRAVASLARAPTLAALNLLAALSPLAATSGPDGRLAGQEPAACPPVEPVEGLEAPFRWLAEADLVPTARLLAARRGAFGPFPGLPDEALPEETRIVLLRDLSCAETLGLADPGVDWVAGFADLARDVVVLRVERAAPAIAPLAIVLRHELAHLALGRATRGGAPRWLQEGYAQLASGSWDWATAWRLRWTFLRDGGERLQRLGLRFPPDPEGARLAYQLSYIAVQELWDLSGERGFEAFTSALAEGLTTERAFRSVFGITEGAFEERWLSRVQSRYGLLYTLSRALAAWSLFALLLVWAWVRRRRIKRERLEELREADRRDAARYGLDVDDDRWPV